jgi:hypothetical protein
MTHLNLDYFSAGFNIALPIVLTLALIGAAIRGIVDSGYRRVVNSYASQVFALGILHCLYLSAGLALLVCWGMGAASTDLAGTDPFVTPAVAVTGALLASAFITILLVGFAHMLADMTWDCLLALAALTRTVVQRAAQGHAAWRARQ